MYYRKIFLNKWITKNPPACPGIPGLSQNTGWQRRHRLCGNACSGLHMHKCSRSRLQLSVGVITHHDNASSASWHLTRKSNGTTYLNQHLQDQGTPGHRTRRQDKVEGVFQHSQGRWRCDLKGESFESKRIYMQYQGLHQQAAMAAMKLSKSKR